MNHLMMRLELGKQRNASAFWIPFSNFSSQNKIVLRGFELFGREEECWMSSGKPSRRISTPILLFFMFHRLYANLIEITFYWEKGFLLILILYSAQTHKQMRDGYFYSMQIGEKESHGKLTLVWTAETFVAISIDTTLNQFERTDNNQGQQLGRSVSLNQRMIYYSLGYTQRSLSYQDDTQKPLITP